MIILSGNSNRPLAKAIAAHLGVPLAQISLHRFADQETFIDIPESVQGQDVFIIQSTSSPANDTVMELLLILDALKRAAARSITAVIPYYGYGRQDRETSPCGSLAAKLVANLLAAAGANHIVTIDWHSPQIQEFFDIPTDNLTLAPLFCKDIEERYKEEPIIIVSPDVGGVARARIVAERLAADLATIDKRRASPGKATALSLMGNVAGKACILIDDITDSAGTLCEAVETLSVAGALSVDAYISHGVLSGNALEKIAASPLRRLAVSDTIHLLPETLRYPKIHVLSAAPLLGKAIDRIAHAPSASGLGEGERENREKGQKIRHRA